MPLALRQMLCLVMVLAMGARVWAGERAKLATPPGLLSQTAIKTANNAKPRTKLLRPARIAVADDEPAPLPAEPAIDPKSKGQKPKAKRKTTTATESTTSPTEVQVAEVPEPATPPVQSSRRTATGAANSPSRIAFRPVEVVPLSPDGIPETKTSRTGDKSSLVDTYRAARERAVTEVYEPVIVSAEPTTAEYEEEVVAVSPAQKKPQAQIGANDEQEPAPIVSAATASGETENLAPIVSAADLPRPTQKRRSLFGELRTPPDLSIPPLFQR
jgi:hypothetical protein